MLFNLLPPAAGVSECVWALYKHLMSLAEGLAKWNGLKVATVMPIESFKIEGPIQAQTLKFQHSTDKTDCKQKFLEVDIICVRK